MLLEGHNAVSDMNRGRWRRRSLGKKTVALSSAAETLPVGEARAKHAEDPLRIDPDPSRFRCRSMRELPFLPRYRIAVPRTFWSKLKQNRGRNPGSRAQTSGFGSRRARVRSEEHTSELQS